MRLRSGKRHTGLPLVVLMHTAHVFDVEGRWAWVIGPGDYARYAEGACPASAPA